jgi:hypothetical protein
MWGGGDSEMARELGSGALRGSFPSDEEEGSA